MVKCEVFAERQHLLCQSQNIERYPMFSLTSLSKIGCSKVIHKMIKLRGSLACEETKRASHDYSRVRILL